MADHHHQGGVKFSDDRFCSHLMSCNVRGQVGNNRMKLEQKEFELRIQMKYIKMTERMKRLERKTGTDST